MFADGAYPCHCGFLSLWQDHPHLIHAHIARRQVVEEPYIGEWPAKVRFAFRFPGTSSAPEIKPETIISGEAE